MALSARVGYIMPFKSMLQLKDEINEKDGNVTCWEYMQRTITINISSIWSLYGKPFNMKAITRISLPSQSLG